MLYIPDFKIPVPCEKTFERVVFVAYQSLDCYSTGPHLRYPRSFLNLRFPVYVLLGKTWPTPYHNHESAGLWAKRYYFCFLMIYHLEPPENNKINRVQANRINKTMKTPSNTLEGFFPIFSYFVSWWGSGEINLHSTHNIYNITTRKWKKTNPVKK